MEPIKYGVFFDREKEPIGFGQKTLFVYDPFTDRIGNVADPKWVRESETFSVFEVQRLIAKLGVERVYLGARETEPFLDLIDMIPKGVAITVETSSKATADSVHRLYGFRVDVVLRVEASYTVKVRNGRSLTFARGMEIWTENSEVRPYQLKELLNEKV